MREHVGKAISESPLVSKVAAEEPPVRAVVARVSQGVESRISVRLFPAREVVLEPILGCQPRKGAPRREAQPIPLPKGLADKLKGANRQVIEWLARDAANTKRFMADPVGALAAADVELTRAEQKALSRAHQAVREVAVVPPGLELGEPTIKASLTGKVGNAPRMRKPTAGGGEGAGC